MQKPRKRGRPKSKEKMEQKTIKLPPKLLKDLRDLSEKTHNPMSFHIREAIVEYLEKKRL